MEKIVLTKKMVRDIRDCIKEDYGDNQSAFGMAVGISATSVSQIVKHQRPSIRSITYRKIMDVMDKKPSPVPRIQAETPEAHQVTLVEMQRDNTQDAILKELKAIHELIEELAKGRT